MTNLEHDGTSRMLRALAIAQAVVIVSLSMLLLRPGEVPPAPAATAADAKAEGNQAPDQALSEAAVRAPEQPSVAPPLQVLRPAAASRTAPTGTVLFGRVVNESGEAVSEGLVWLRRVGEQKQLATIRARQGHSEFAIAGLPPGRIEFQTHAAGYKQQRGSIDIPAGVPRVRHDIVLEPSWLLTVKILTPEGKPLHEELQAASKERPMLWHVEVGAVVTATKPDGDFPLTPLREIEIGLGRWRGATGAGAVLSDGRPRLPKDTAGVIEIDKKQALWASAVMRHHVLASVPVEPGQAEVTLTVALEVVLKDLCCIRGRVVDAATGAAVANASVSFGDLQSSGAGSKTDEQGRFEVKDLRPGLLTVGIRGDKKHSRRDLIRLAPGQVLELGDVPVFEFRTIKGRCEGMVGKAEEGRIAYTPLDPVWHPAVQHYTESARVAADGSFTFALPEGRYLLRASGAGSAVVEIDTRTLGDQPLVLQLKPEAMLRLDVQTNGESWELALFDSSGREVYRRDLRDGWKLPLPFLPGTYRAELTGPNGRTETRQVHLGAAGADLRVP